MDNTKLANLVQDARYITMSEHVLMPLLSDLESGAVSALCGKFLKGETQLLGDVAYLVSIRNLRTALQGKQNRGNSLSEKLNKEIE